MGKRCGNGEVGMGCFFFSSRRRHTRLQGDWSSDVCSSDLLLEVRPGLTGLWQVNGRSRLRFDDMVRLDLKYATAWSLWLDVKILLQTPRAVFSVDGAF